MEKEIKDHAVKAIKTIKDPRLKFWNKVGEISIEVAIIVFAVTLSIWVHDISDHNHEQKDVKSFLLGLKKDLSSDIIQLQGDRYAYTEAGMAFKYFTTSTPNFKLSVDSIIKYQTFLFNLTGLVPNNGRYEGFKSSGKLGNIENDSLQNHIVQLYQEAIPAILASTDSYSQRKQYLFEYLNKNLKRTKERGYNIIDVLSTDEANNICKSLTDTDEIVAGYNNAIKQSKKIIEEINAEYDLK